MKFNRQNVNFVHQQNTSGKNSKKTSLSSQPHRHPESDLKVIISTTLCCVCTEQEKYENKKKSWSSSGIKRRRKLMKLKREHRSCSDWMLMMMLIRITLKRARERDDFMLQSFLMLCSIGLIIISCMWIINCTRWEWRCETSVEHKNTRILWDRCVWVWKRRRMRRERADVDDDDDDDDEKKLSRSPTIHNIPTIKECDIRTFYLAIFNYDSCSTATSQYTSNFLWLVGFFLRQISTISLSHPPHTARICASFSSALAHSSTRLDCVNEFSFWKILQSWVRIDEANTEFEADNLPQWQLISSLTYQFSRVDSTSLIGKLNAHHPSHHI